MSNLNLKLLTLIVFIYVLFCEKCLSHDVTEINRATKSGEKNDRVTEKEVWITKQDKFDETTTIKDEQSSTFSSDNINVKTLKKHRISRQINYGRSSMYPAGSTSYPTQSNYTTYNGYSSNSNNYSVTQKYPHNQYSPTGQYSTTLNNPPQNPVSDRPPYYPAQQNSHSSHSSYPNSNNYYQNTSDHQSSKPNQIVYSQNSYSNNNHINVSSPRTLYPFSRYVNISQHTDKYPHNSSVSNGPVSPNYANSMNSYRHTNNNTINQSKDTPFMYNRVLNYTNNPWNVPSSNVNTRHENSVPNFVYNSSRAYYPENPTYHNSNHTSYQSHHYPQNSSTYPGYSVYDTNSFNKENLNITDPRFSHFYPTTNFNSSYSSYPTNKYPTSSLKNNNQNNFSYNNSFQSQGIEPNHFFYTPGNKTVAYDPHQNSYNFQYSRSN